jgi:asparagine synthetase B (glutamine-hydrolysing)
MCGIAGILRIHPPNADIPPPLVAIPEAWLDILDDSIKHRGPDGKGRFRDRDLGGTRCAGLLDARSLRRKTTLS